jgi:putative two-component system response regulator
MNQETPVILCVDDEMSMLELLERMLLRQGYQTVGAASGEEALAVIGSRAVDLVVLDIAMPGMDGVEVSRRIRENRELSDIPIILLSGLSSEEDRVRGIEAGVEDYFVKPFNSGELLARIKILLKVKKSNEERRWAEEELKKSHAELDSQVKLKTAELRQANAMLQADILERQRSGRKLQEALDNLRKAFGTIVQVMVAAVEIRDPYTSGHQLRAADLARAIATEMALPKDRIEGIRMAGSIHDIGKLSIPAEILSKPTRLSAVEFLLIKEHARQGYEILKEVESPWPLAEIVYEHHERLDGSGYPRQLRGEEILLEARILSVADVVEAMASHRPYRPGLGIDRALEEISANRGVLYDPGAADACLRLFCERGYRLE